MSGLKFENIQVKTRNIKSKAKTITDLIDKLYVPFGKYILNTKQLKQNVLLIKNKKGLAPIAKLKRTEITDDFKNLLTDLIDTQRINIELQKELNNNEVVIFETLLSLCNLKNVLNYKRYSKSVDDYFHRLKIIQGSFNAGNTSNILKQEAIDIIKVLSSPIINKISLVDAEILIECLT
jgi:hypothetical protein